MSIQDRIAALNLGHVGRTPQSVPTPPIPADYDSLQEPPIPPPRPSSTTNSFLNVKGENHASTVGNQPNQAANNAPFHPEKKKMPPPMLASKKYAQTPPPSLPPRTNTNGSTELALSRRTSSESFSSTASSSAISAHTSTSTTSFSRRPSGGVIPDGPKRTLTVPEFDPSSLPPLPQKKAEQPKRPSLSSTHSSSSVASVKSAVKAAQPTPPPQSMPPQRPAQPAQPPRHAQPARPVQPAQPAQVIPVAKPPPLPVRKASADTGAGAVESQQRRPSVPTVKVQQPASQTHVHTNGQTNGVKTDPAPKKSALSWGMNKPEPTPAVPQRPSSTTTEDQAPPPIPLGSKPNLAQLQASKPKPSAPVSQPVSKPASQSLSRTTSQQQECLKCRDFSGPDNHAARFPRESIPSLETSWLAAQLTSPFESATDKARAIFTWLHHNIAYDVAGFFSGEFKNRPKGPGGTMSSGLAVCEGYAGLFAVLATQAGLEAIVVGGHGKGYGYKPLQPGEAVPPFDSGHAWNAVKIDNGEWKLLDACWGAGAVNDDRTYNKRFEPEEFTKDNATFGLTHFPKDQNHHFRPDGRVPTWEEYYVGDGNPEKVLVYSGARPDHGLAPTKFYPQKKHITVRGAQPNARTSFQFETYCPHWDHLRHGKGKPYVFVLGVGGRDGRERDQIPFNTDGKQKMWWLDVPTRDLGCAGQTVSVFAITTIDGKDARGYTVEQYKAAKGRKSMSWSGVCAWQLV